jgi:hypothetical protein
MSVADPRPNRHSNLEWVLTILLGAFIACLAFYNLKNNPATWHDEGSNLSLAKALASDGVYAVRSSDGFQTYGAVQSIGPTVVLPVTLAFKLLGVGLVPGRIVASLYLLLALLAFIWLGRGLYGRGAAALAVLLLLGSAAPRILFYGRQVLGEVPALAFFLGGFLLWFRSARLQQNRYAVFAGLLIGAAMVTKSYFVPFTVLTISVMAVLDRFYYRQQRLAGLLVMGGVGLACVAVWFGWQVTYFGLATFRENLGKLGELARATSGFRLGSAFQALKFLLGSEGGYFYYFWGIPAIAYAGLLSLRRDLTGFSTAFLTVFTCAWFAWWALWFLPIKHYALVPAAITALLVGKLWYDLAEGLRAPWSAVWQEVRQAKPGRACINVATLLLFGIMITYSLQARIRPDILASSLGSQRVAEYLNEHVDRGAVVETWERELAILTEHTFHFPDQSFLTEAHADDFRGGMFGPEYFERIKPAYLIVGWYARWGAGGFDVYDMDFVHQSGNLVASIDEYEIYRMRW